MAEGVLTMTKLRKKFFYAMVLVMVFMHYYGPLMICAAER